MSGARVRGDFRDLQRRVQQGTRRGLRSVTQNVHRHVQLENPVDTGRSRAAWVWTFNTQTLRGVVGNPTWYIRIVAEGGYIAAHVVRARHAKALRFKPRGSARFIYRRQVYVPGRRVPSTQKERRNIGFHRRGAAKGMARATELLTNALRAAGVPLTGGR